MEFETLSFSEKKGILHVRLNRPEKRNAINGQMLLDLEQCFTEVATRSSIKVVILSGEGKAFCAGTDLNEIGETSSSESPEIRQFVRKGQRAFSEMDSLEKAVIALIHGYAIGGGLEMILACDLRIASEEAVFSIPEVNVGLVPDLGGSQRLPRIVGLAKAKELILMGKNVSAMEAEHIGLVNKVVPLNQLEETGKAWAEEIMRNDMVAVGLAKRNIDMSLSQSLSDGLESAGMAQSLLMTGNAFKKRAKARLTQRNPSKKTTQ